MKTEETEESPGVVSSMRVTLKHARTMEPLYLIASVILCAVAAAIGIKALEINAAYAIPVATGILAVAAVIAAAGAGQKTAVTAFKAFQAKSEVESPDRPDLSGTH